MDARSRLRHALMLALISGAGLCLAACAAMREEPVSWTTDVVASPDGVTIAHQAAGEGPVSVVFVHGWLGDRTYWRHQLDVFARSHRVVALDLAGHGDSGVARDEWTFRAFGEDVAAVVEHLGLERVVLVGHSMGGPVIVEAARLVPSRVVGLVAVDSLQDPAANAMAPEAIEAFLEPFEADFPAAVRRLVGRSMFAPGSDPELQAWIVEDMASARPGPGRGALRANMEWAGTTRSEALAALPAPVRLINSDLFRTNEDATERYGMEVTLMPGRGHFVMLEDPDAFNTLLASAIDELTR